MPQSKWFVALSLVLLYGSLNASPAEHIVWDKTPIDVNLSLTEERFIHFPQAISIIDSEEKENIAILKVRNSLYLKAKKAFAHKRLVVQLMPQGDVIILSLSANEKITLTPPLDILIDQKDGDANSANNTDNTKTNLDINAITLTRFAIQSLYAPERLLIVPNGVVRTPMQTQRQVTLFYGANVTARPLISWHATTFYITAVELKNELATEVILDPRRMLGHWQTATFYPTNTLAGRTKKITTTVFLVSDRPFNEALMASREFVR